MVVAGITTAWIAWRSDDGVVAQDYYKRGLLVNKTIAALPPAAAPIVADVTLDASGALRVMARTPDAEDETLAATLTHPASGTRQEIVLQRAADGSFGARVNSPLAGRWVVTFAPRHGMWPTTLVQRGGSGSSP